MIITKVYYKSLIILNFNLTQHTKNKYIRQLSIFNKDIDKI